MQQNAARLENGASNSGTIAAALPAIGGSLSIAGLMGPPLLPTPDELARRAVELQLHERQNLMSARTQQGLRKNKAAAGARIGPNGSRMIEIWLNPVAGKTTDVKSGLGIYLRTFDENMSMSG